MDEHTREDLYAAGPRRAAWFTRPGGGDFWRRLAGLPDQEQRARLETLLIVPEGSRVSPLDRRANAYQFSLNGPRSQTVGRDSHAAYQPVGPVASALRENDDAGPLRGCYRQLLGFSLTAPCDNYIIPC